MDSLEEKVSMFIDEQCYHFHSNYSSESELHEEEEDLWWENNCDSNDSRDRTSYWESQVALLKEILERYHLSGSKLRREVGRIIEEVKGSDFCSCFKPNNSLDCTTCLRRQVVTELRHRGFTTNLCISKWGTTKKFPGGCHECIEVIANTSTGKQIHFLIELELREQFQIAKAGEKYQKLVSCLPEFYIGKPEYLTAIVRVLCNAAKKSMKEKKMHMGPWRKSSFMQMKWSGFNQTYNNESFGTHTTYPLQHSSQSYIRISGAPTRGGHLNLRKYSIPMLNFDLRDLFSSRS